jgi:DNA polymerase
MMNIEEKQAALDELKKLIEQENLCPELSKGATNMVFGSGNADADLVFIGEAPGKKEDLTGEPFVGASGKVLDELLASVQIERAEVYITSILKHRPPNNRDPMPNEKKAFWPYLLEQIAILQPKLVVTLGRHSGQAFLKDLRISADHGKPKQITVSTNEFRSTLLVLPLYHPAAALYNGKLRATLHHDFKQVAQILNNQ